MSIAPPTPGPPPTTVDVEADDEAGTLPTPLEFAPELALLTVVASVVVEPPFVCCCCCRVVEFELVFDVLLAVVAVDVEFVDVVVVLLALALNAVNDADCGNEAADRLLELGVVTDVVISLAIKGYITNFFKSIYK